MDFVLSVLLKVGFIALAVGGVFATKKLLKTKDDNVVEEVVENVIKDELGISIDLTPDSPEGPESEFVKGVSYFVSDALKKIDKVK